jgi:microcompartment protein CcmL/EutN
MLLSRPHDSGALALFDLADTASGMWITDQALKKAPVQLIMCRPCEPGKFLLGFTGDVASVETAHSHVLSFGESTCLDHVLLQQGHAKLWSALDESLDLGEDPDVGTGSMLTVECFTVAGTLRALDRGLKTAPCRILRLHLADDYGGKGFFVLSGALEDLQAIEEASQSAAAPRLVSSRLIAHPDPELPSAPAEGLTLTTLTRDRDPR